VLSARHTIDKARDSQRLNPRRVLGPAPALTSLDSALDILEHIAVFSRTSLRVLDDAARAGGTSLDTTFLRPDADLLHGVRQAIQGFADDQLGAATRRARDAAASPSLAECRRQSQTLAQQVPSLAAQPCDLLAYTAVLAAADRLITELETGFRECG
jgi:hypothetical protein